MNTSITYDEQFQILHVLHSGRFHLEAYKAAASQLVESMQLHDCTRVLIDQSQLINLASTLEIYNLPETLVAEGVDRSIRCALLPPENDKNSLEHVQFFETVAQNQGFRVKIFQQQEEAITWLQNGFRPDSSASKPKNAFFTGRQI